MTELMRKQWEHERARVPKANPYPYTTDYPVVNNLITFLLGLFQGSKLEREVILMVILPVDSSKARTQAVH